MKALLLLYSALVEEDKDKLYEKIEKNINVLNRVIGIDSIYACVSSQFKDIFERFPEVCLINNLKDTSVFAAYKGLRKLRGNDVLIVDGSVSLTKEGVFKFFNRVHVTVGVVKEKWSGLAFVKMRDIDYVIRSLEKNFEESVLDAFYTLRDTYSIVTEFITFKEKASMPILDLK